ncbi:MAG TPA: carbohydrate ABC transporter permease [Chloroflexota bacterium]|nr:carbohydrate ABC transporter permease [Chloroflexota bacterium]
MIDMIETRAPIETPIHPIISRRSPGRIVRRTVIRFCTVYLPTILLILFVITPFLWMLLGSFKTNIELMSSQGQTLWIKEPTLDNYVRLFHDYPFARFFLNSTIVATGTTMIAVSFSAFAGYSLSRFSFPGRTVIGVAFLVTQMLPGVAILIALYIQFRDFGLLNNYAGLIIGYNAFSIPFCTWMLRGFFDSIPRELEEAALIDGCNRVTSFFSVALPLTLPGLLATGIFAFILAWHEFVFAVTMINDTKMFTLTVGIASMKSINIIDWGLLNAGVVVTTIPLVILFAFVQRYLIQGLTAGAVKG